MERLFHFPLGKTTWTCSIEATRTATLLRIYIYICIYTYIYIYIYIYIYVRLNHVLEHLGPNLMHIVRRSETIDSKTTIIIRKRHAMSPPAVISFKCQRDGQLTIHLDHFSHQTISKTHEHQHLMG